MNVKYILDEDFVNYKEASMFIATTKCSFKCCKEAGSVVCQNVNLEGQPNIYINDEDLVQRYLDNPITTAIVIGGMEPFDTLLDVINFIIKVREKVDHTIVIYTGYKEEEVPAIIKILKQYKNIIVKFGRFVPGTKTHLDPVLGVEIYEPQYAVKIS